MPRQQLPPQIKKITLKNGKVRYHVKENGRVDPVTKQRPKLDKRKHSASALTWCFARVIGPGRICCGAGVVVGQAGAGSGGIQGWSRMASRRACSAL